MKLILIFALAITQQKQIIGLIYETEKMPLRRITMFVCDIYLRLQAIQRPELCVRGMAFSFNTEIGRRFGFRTDIIRGEDGSLALAMKPYGKIVFITSRKARVLTSNGTLNSEGSLIDNIWIRVIKALKEITGLFIKKTAYKDKDSNLIK